ncbi:DNA methylase [Sphaerochaeta pleomorpha str. Grapes]|uniref:site-specific DNA-methyltransferase (cytosine-N(4)-specific) n=1 Tax=Sphaerochaeta pleomorpha (strain ATCC BAA-1885 / DSM 22778 / Grapes) TaxID=158190 RepID=G8QT97_SPHPG|nr:DNA methyltransferase [Sphaerochaeta pleomorpha]AEV29064.1 DNA methylase [Sphaerochaeta pleomorpha str. Grapes]
MFKHTDYSENYGAVMQFNTNKHEPIHRWYPFVEGYSKEFIDSILEEVDLNRVQCSLDPFSGSGTTPLVLQNKKMKCYSFEVSPFMHELSYAKLTTTYKSKSLLNDLDKLNELLIATPEDIDNYITFPKSKYYVQSEEINRWHYNLPTMTGIADLIYAFSKIDNLNNQRLFRIALASILIPISNMYRNGKCLSYKKNWKDIPVVDRQEVHQLFTEKIQTIFVPDIIQLEKQNNENLIVSNREYCLKGSALNLITTLPDESIDLVITSPPYLNSRDYTDSYIDELRVLGYFTNLKAERAFRATTLKSHVQVSWEDLELISVPTFKRIYHSIEIHEAEFWNKNILKMINGYFSDLKILLDNLFLKMKPGGQVFLNIGNSAYFGIVIPVDEIIAELAELSGFAISEIRIARNMKSSGQQKNSVTHLVESVIVMQKK